MPPAFYCWNCYSQNDRPSGACATCGLEIAAPESASYKDTLVWALDHPVPDTAMTAAAILGRLKAKEATGRLRQLAVDAPDPYLARRALQSLLEINGPDAERELLERLAGQPSFLVSAVARAALGR